MSLCRSERVAVLQPKKRASKKDGRSSRRYAVEPLEHRNLLTLLGVSPSFPTITYDSTGTVTYNATTDSFALQAQPLIYKASAIASPQVITTPRSFTINVNIDSTGNLVPNLLTSDLIVTGTIVGSPGLSGTILTAKVIAFGYQYTGSGTDNYDFIAIPTGGTLFSMFAGLDVGVTVASANSTFTNNFNVNFNGLAKGTIGSVPLYTGNISGNKFNDITGNGFSGDDTGLGGVSINLFRDFDNSGTLTPGDGAAIATTTTAGWHRRLCIQQSGARHVLRSGSCALRPGANRRRHLYRQRHLRQQHHGTEFRRLQTDQHQRHEIQRHHRRWFHRRRHRLGRRDDQFVPQRRQHAGRFDRDRRQWFVQL